MIDGTRRWLRRNRSNFAIGIGVLGAGYLAGQYVVSKITDARERMAIDRTAKENLRRRFQQNQEDCTFTVLALLPTATENVLEALPVESITHELQQKKAQRLGQGASAAASERSSGAPSVTDEDGRSLASFQSESYVHASQMAASSSGSAEPGAARPQKSKAQLWNELKITSITRSFTLLYTLSLLALLTRIQLNLLGRRNYLSSVVSMASHPPQDSTISLENNDDDNMDQSYGNDFETNREFLTFSWWLLHRGWRDIMSSVESAVKEVFGPINPREDIPLEKLSSLTLDVRRIIEGTTPEERSARKYLPYLLPSRSEESLVLHESGMTSSPPFSSSSSNPSPSTTSVPPPKPITPTLRRLLDETSDLIDSPPFTHILTLLLDITFSLLTDTKIRAQAYKLPPLLPPPSASTSSRIEEITDEASPAGLTNAKTKLATILAVMTRQAHGIGNGVPNEYVQAMEGVREVETFAAVIFSSPFEGEGPEAPHEESASASEVKDGEEEQEMEQEVRPGFVGQVGGVVDKVGGVFGNLWARVVGMGEGNMTG